jgi:hypothetical protein
MGNLLVVFLECVEQLRLFREYGADVALSLAELPDEGPVFFD